MRKPNYSMERKDRDRAKQVKAAAKLEKRAAKAAEGRGADGEEQQEQPAEELPAAKGGNG